MMNEKQIQVRLNPFLLWSVGIFLLCMVPLLALFCSEILPGNGRRFAFIITFLGCAVAALAGAFIVCALVQAIRGFRSGYLVLADVVAPAILTVILGLFALVYALFPTLAGIIELSFWVACLVVWSVDAIRRVIRKKKDRRASGLANVLK